MKREPSLLDAIKAGLFTSLWSGLATLGITVLAWLVDVSAWLSTVSTGGSANFPSPRLLGFAVVGLVVSVAGGIVGATVRWAQAQGFVKGKPPKYGSDGR